jgi:phage baseplate assembly protein W
MRGMSAYQFSEKCLQLRNKNMSTITPKFPIQIVADQAAMSSYEEGDILSAIRFNIKNIVLTNPGERIMDSNFGSGITQMLFEQPSSNFSSEVKRRVQSQIKQYAPYINLKEISVNYNGESGIVVSVSYEVPELDINDYFDITTSV